MKVKKKSKRSVTVNRVSSGDGYELVSDAAKASIQKTLLEHHSLDLSERIKAGIRRKKMLLQQSAN
jgi:hypothetical protein